MRRRRSAAARLPVPPALALLALAVPLVLAGCGPGAGDDDVLTVLAAASLDDGFSTLAQRFEETHDGVEVRLSLGGSADLAAQVRQGAPADVVATADEATMAALVGEDLVDDPTVFATNTLTIAVPPGNPAGVRSPADLGRDDVQLVLCAPQVPCGAAALRLARVAGVVLAPVSEEQSVTDVLGKVASGEADAGLVYVTDVAGAGDAVEEVAVPEAGEVVNRYPVAALVDAPSGDLAAEFVALVTSAEGREVLAGAGFGAP